MIKSDYDNLCTWASSATVDTASSYFNARSALAVVVLDCNEMFPVEVHFHTNTWRNGQLNVRWKKPGGDARYMPFDTTTPVDSLTGFLETAVDYAMGQGWIS